MRAELKTSGTAFGQLSVLLINFLLRNVFGWNHSIEFLPIPFYRKVMNCGSPLSLLISRGFEGPISPWGPSKVFWSFRKSSLRGIEARKCPSSWLSRIDKQLMFSADSITVLLLWVWWKYCSSNKPCRSSGTRSGIRRSQMTEKIPQVRRGLRRQKWWITTS